MKMSVRAKRMQRHHGRMKKKSDLNLTSLMDIFTILVFFLMVNSSDTQILKDSKDIIMPKSVAEEMPKETLIIQVSNSVIVVQGREVAEVPAVVASEEDVIKALEEELNYQASRRPQMTEEELQSGRAVTIQGHNELPYSLLKKIMATCAFTDFRDISLAVTRNTPKASNGQGG
jgi:biopolymer transport protein ExbD